VTPKLFAARQIPLILLLVFPLTLATLYSNETASQVVTTRLRQSQNITKAINHKQKNDFGDKFSERLKSLMKARGLTQDQVAMLAGVSQGAVFKWLRSTIPGAAELHKFAQSQDLPVEWFFSELTYQALSLTTETVRPVMPKLIERLKRATAQRGSKTALAKWLGVHRQCVTDWLSGQEPGGEMTLRLLQWVELQERKQIKAQENAQND
jgi:transcriptional regulator with XRE-family HTH domain